MEYFYGNVCEIDSSKGNTSKYKENKKLLAIIDWCEILDSTSIHTKLPDGEEEQGLIIHLKDIVEAKDIINKTNKSKNYNEIGLEFFFEITVDGVNLAPHVYFDSKNKEIIITSVSWDITYFILHNKHNAASNFTIDDYKKEINKYKGMSIGSIDLDPSDYDSLKLYVALHDK